MSGAAVWLLLAGAALVPLALLTTGGGLHRRSRRVRAAFRGASLGFVAALPLVVLVLVLPPLRWPPEPALHLAIAIGALPGAAVAGALAAVLLQRPSRHPPRKGQRVDGGGGRGVDQGVPPRVS